MHFNGNSECQTLNDLLKKYEVNSPEWKAIIAIYATAHGYKLLNKALNQMQEQINAKTAIDIIRDLPDDLDRTISVKHSVALFNTWCNFQGISP